MNKINEADYSEIFRPKTLSKLKQSSAENLKKMLKGKSYQKASMDSMRMLRNIMEIEYKWREELANLAVSMCQELFPILEDNNIEIQAEITDDIQIPPASEDEREPTEEDQIRFPEEAKRRIINSITQGSAIRNSFMFYMFKEYLDLIDPELLTKYEELLNDSYGIYDDDNAIAMMMAMIAQGGKGGGVEDVVYNEEEDRFVIKAAAVTFPILLQEIIKGLYEILSLQGFSSDIEQNKKIVKTVDKVTNEPEDIRYGKYIYDAVNQVFIGSNAEDSRVREYLLAEIYKLDSGDFISLIENLINNELSSNQKNWLQSTIDSIVSDLKKDDTGLEDLE